MLVRRENASLTAIVCCVVSAVFCGNGPSIRDFKQWGFKWALDFSYCRWGAEAWYGREISPFKGLYDLGTSQWMFGFELDTFWSSVGYMMLIGFTFRIIAFALLIGLNRSRQK